MVVYLYMSISTQIICILRFENLCALINAFQDLDLKLRKQKYNVCHAVRYKTQKRCIFLVTLTGRNRNDPDGTDSVL